MTDTALAYAALGDILGEHRAYIGATGSGKSTTARGHVERLLRERRHTCVTDHLGVWWGLRSDAAGTGAGFDIPIFGGRKGDVAFGAGDGAAIGKIVGDGVSAIVDLSGLRTGGEQREFMRGLIGALRAKPPGHFQLVCDEADEDIPERIRDEAGFALQEDMIWIAKRGRSDGFVLSLITQRPASIAKEALSQAQTIFAHQLIAPTDKKALGDYVKSQGTAAEFKEIMARLPTLQVGERYLYSPKRHLLELGRSPMPETFDSSRTPGPGERRAEPKLLSEIDVSAIAAALKKPEPEWGDRVKRGEELQQLLAAKDAEIARLKIGLELSESERRDLAADLMILRHRGERLRAELERIAHLAGSAARAGERDDHLVADENARSATAEEPVAPAPTPADGEAASSGAGAASPTAAAEPHPPGSGHPAGGEADGNASPHLPPRHVKILAALQWCAVFFQDPAASRRVLAWAAGTSPVSSGFEKDLGALRSAGLIDYPSAGLVALTPAGEAIAPPRPRKAGRDELFAAIAAKLPPRRVRLLEILWRRLELKRDALAELAGTSPQSSGFEKDLGAMRTLGLVTYPSPRFVALAEIFR
jgi:uncharacterized protein